MLYFNSRFWHFAVVSTRIFLGLLFFTGGMSKLMPFPGVMGPTWLIERLAEYELELYGYFIAYSQVTIGLLLLSQRFATLGAVMLFPLLLNMFVITVSMHWRGTPYVIAVFILMNIFLLIADYHRLKYMLFPRTEALTAPRLTRPHLRLDGLTLFGIGMLIFCPTLYGLAGNLAYGVAILGLVSFPVSWGLERAARRKKEPGG
ncbi:MAG: DoxX family membrane protein [Phaeodactylibacter sp.]|nr:DoxX family membrane protein [Phaeodactylibacter sp.]MCB9051203.1 DoxX family membrane protein [Lewinellaceae bacterium]